MISNILILLGMSWHIVVIESLATKGTEVSLHVAVALHVPVQQALQAKRLRTDPDIGIL
mgnify:CR=1 FL=1